MTLITKIKEAIKVTVKENTLNNDKQTLKNTNATLLKTHPNLTNNRNLYELERILTKFDSELCYANIHCDLTNKYKLGKEYFKCIEELRCELVRDGKLNKNATGKEEFIRSLDKVVPGLIKDFTVFAEEKYKLLDEIFLIQTNSHWKCDVEDLGKRVDRVLIMPDVLYNQEFEKMCSIHDILENEEKRLQKLK